MEKLGIQPIQLLLQAINFLIILLILKKFLYRPILKMLDDRKKKIDEGLLYSDRMKSEFEKSEKKRAEVVEKGKIEAQKLIIEARKAAKEKENEIIEKAEKEAAGIIERAEKENMRLRQDLEKEIQIKAVNIAERIVKKTVIDALNEKMHRAIIDKKLKEISSKIK